MVVLSRIGRENEWVNGANHNFRVMGIQYDELREDDSDKELCFKIRKNFGMASIKCLVEPTMNIDDRLKIINDCFKQFKIDIS